MPPLSRNRLTRTLKRSSETTPPLNSSSGDSAYSTATLNNASSDYQNVMTVSDDNVYCEIASPAAAAAAYAHQGWACWSDAYSIELCQSQVMGFIFHCLDSALHLK